MLQCPQETLVFKSPPDDIIEEFTGKKMLCYFDDDLSVVHLTYENRYICGCERVRRVNMLDSEAVKRAAEAAAKRNNEARAVLAPLMPTKAGELAAMREHNRGVLREAEKVAREIRRSNSENKKRNAAQNRALMDFEDSAALVGAPSVPESHDCGLEDFSDPSELI